MWDSANDFDRLAMQGEDTGVAIRQRSPKTRRGEYVGPDLRLRGPGWVTVRRGGIWFEPDFRGGDVFRIEPGDYKIL